MISFAPADAIRVHWGGRYKYRVGSAGHCVIRSWGNQKGGVCGSSGCRLLSMETRPGDWVDLQCGKQRFRYLATMQLYRQQKARQTRLSPNASERNDHLMWRIYDSLSRKRKVLPRRREKAMPLLAPVHHRARTVSLQTRRRHSKVLCSIQGMMQKLLSSFQV